jgi:hypothetical protein
MASHTESALLPQLFALERFRLESQSDEMGRDREIQGNHRQEQLARMLPRERRVHLRHRGHELGAQRCEYRQNPEIARNLFRR